MTPHIIRPKRELCQLAAALMFFQSVLPVAAVRADGGALAGVQGGTVVAGQGTISTDGSTLNVNTMTDRTIINWNGFSIGAGETANFFQPGANSAVLNRVTTPNNPTAIFGAMNSNGNVILVNPSGIMVGASGVINTNGFTASTLDIPNNEFLQGGVLNFRGDSTASVINEGTIKTGNGGAALIGANVINNGSITSEGGSISLATGGSVKLADGSRFTHADMATIESGISPTAGLIKNSGTIRATGAMETGGEVFLVNPGGKIMQDGTIAAYRSGSTGVDGGDVKVAARGGSAEIGGTIDVSGRKGGNVTVEAKTIELAGANIDASGRNAGGEVYLGGGFQGRDETIVNAETTSIDRDSKINVDATDKGDGGVAVVWSDQATRFSGGITSRGGEQGGDGGLVEVSGRSMLFDGTVDTTAAMGATGWLLLDPVGIRVVSGPIRFPRFGSDPIIEITDGQLNFIMRFTNTLLATPQVFGEADNIVVSAGTAIDTGDNTLFFSTSQVDLYSDIVGNVAGGREFNLRLPRGLQLLRDPSVVNVYGAGDGGTASIQDGVDIVGLGGTVNVGDGVFAGGVVVDKTINLLGDGYENTSLIEVASDSVGIKVLANDVLVDGFRFEAEDGASNTTGVQLGEGGVQARNNTVSNSGFFDLNDGIVLQRVGGRTEISEVVMNRILDRGVHAVSSLAGDSVVISDSRIRSRGEAVRFDGSMLFSRVDMRGNSLTSRNADAIHFDGELALSDVLIGGLGRREGNSISGGDDGIEFDGNLDGMFIQIAGNQLVEGADEAIEFDNPVRDSRVAIVDNGTISGGDNGIQFGRALRRSDVRIAGNERVEALDNDAILFADTMVNSDVTIGATEARVDGRLRAFGGNEQIVGDEDGINVDEVENSRFSVVGNGRVRGADGSGIEFDGDVSDGSEIEVVRNRRVVGGDFGIEFDAAVEDSDIRIARNDTVEGRDREGISFRETVRRSDVKVNRNGSILGGENGVAFADRVRNSQVTVDANQEIRGASQAGVKFDSAVRDSLVEVLDNGRVAGGRSGIQFEGDLRSSDLVIAENRRVRGRSGAGVRIAGDVDDARLTVVNNRKIKGGRFGIDVSGVMTDGYALIANNGRVSGERVSGISFRGGLQNSFVDVTSNRQIVGGGDGIRFDGIENSQVQISRNRRVIGRSAAGIGIRGEMRSANVRVAGNGRIRGGENGLAVDGAIRAGSVLRVSENHALVGRDAAGVKVQGPIRNSFLAVNGNDRVAGKQTGVQVGGNVRGSGVQIAGNGQVIGRQRSGIRFSGGVEESGVFIAANRVVVGGRDGVAFAGELTDSQVAVVSNRRVEGQRGSGIRMGDKVTDSRIDAVGNREIRGGDAGVLVAGDLVDSRLVIRRNGEINGRDVAGVAVLGRVENSKVGLRKNNISSRRGDGVLLAGRLSDSKIRIKKNRINAGGDGVQVGGRIVDSDVEVKRNQIRASRNGILIRSVRGNSEVALIENRVRVTGNGSGIRLQNLDSSQPVLVQGGSTRGGRFGLNVVQRGRRALEGKVVVDGLEVNDASQTGIQFKTRGDNKSLEVTLRNAVTVNGNDDPASVGMVFDGPGISLSGNSLGDTRFVRTPGNFIELRNGALFAPGKPTLIDGTGVYWDGLDPTLAAQRQIIIDRIIDFLDDPTLGLIFPGASPYLGEQTYDRFTRYEDYFRTIDALMGPPQAGAIRYPMPRQEVAESLGDEADGAAAGDAEDQTAESQTADDAEAADRLDLAVR